MEEKNKTGKKRAGAVKSESAVKKIKKTAKKLKVNVRKNADYEAGLTPFVVNLNKEMSPGKKNNNKEVKQENKIEEKSDNNEKKPKMAERKIPIKNYRKIALSFIFLTAGFLAVFIYFSFLSLDIILIPAKEKISGSLNFNVYSSNSFNADQENSIVGLVEEIEASSTKNYLASGSKIIGEDVSGKAIIYNKSGKNQPLVATTRLIADNNILFRLRETVNVPAGGKVEAEIYADQPAEDIVLAPTKFLIPGLWAGLQDKIYAETEATIKYQKSVKKIITQEDIDNGIIDLKKELLKKKKAEIVLRFKGFDQGLYQIDDNSLIFQVSGKPGEETDEFSITVKANIIAVMFKDDEIKKTARRQLISSLSEGKELIDFEEKNIVYSLNNYNLKQKSAAISSSFDGQMVIKNDSQIIDRNKIAGLQEEQIKKYLDNVPEISGYEIIFFPAFIGRAPDLVDRIKIEIKNK
jgi:hypothetical protein